MKKVSVILLCLCALCATVKAQRFYEGWETYNHNINYSKWTVMHKVAMRPLCDANSKGWNINVVGNTVIGSNISAPTGGDTNKNVVTFSCGADPNKGTDSWLISPKIKNVQDGDYLSFYMVNFSGSENGGLQVLISTTGTDTTTFKVLDEFPEYRSTNWASYS